MDSTASEMAKDLTGMDKREIDDAIGKVKAVGNVVGGIAALVIVGEVVNGLPVHPVIKICGKLFIDLVIIDEACGRAEKNWYGRR